MARWRQAYRDRDNREQFAWAGTVAELRTLRARLFADPDVSWICPSVHCAGNEELAGVDVCPNCGAARSGSTGGLLQLLTCQCGIVHVQLRCVGGCRQTTLTPPRHDGCRPIPWDHEAVSDALYRRHASRRWRAVGR